MRSIALVLLTSVGLISCGSIANFKNSGSKSAAEANTYQSSWVTISKELLSSTFAKKVDESEPVQDCYNGTCINGTAQNAGETYVEISNNPNKASFSILYKGTVDSRTVGRKNVGGGRHVVVNSRSHSGVHARKQIYFQQEGYTSLDSKTNATTDLDILGVTLYNGMGNPAVFGQQQAYSQVMGQRQNSENHANERTTDKTNEKIDKDTNKELLAAQKDYAKSFLDPIVKPGYFPGAMVTNSVPEQMRIITNQPLSDRTGNVADKPSMDQENGMSVSMHETLVNGIFTNMFSGKKLKMTEFKKMLASLTGADPVITPDDDKYSISFPDDKNPMEVKFDGARMDLTIRSTGYYVDDVREPSMEVTANYKLSITDAGELRGSRDGAISVLPTGYKPGDPLSSRQRDLQAKLKKAYANELKDEFIMKDLPFAKSFGNGKLLVKDLVAKNGWLGMVLDN